MINKNKDDNFIDEGLDDVSNYTLPNDNNGWQPIETAPKDGSPILGYAKKEYTTIEWSIGGYWTLCICGEHASDGEWWPTHWMPLPQPPKTK